MKKVSEVFKKGKHDFGYISDSFLNEFGDTEIVAGHPLKNHKIIKFMTDTEIIKEFGIQECTLGDVLATLDLATEEMKDGYANIFYIKGHPSRVVSVAWRCGGWNMRDWPGDDDATWQPGVRIFSPATVAGNVYPMIPETLELGSHKYTEIVEWLYLNAGQLPSDTKTKLLAKLKEIIN